MKKRKVFTMRIQHRDLEALRHMAAGDGVSMTDYITWLVRREAKKQGIPGYVRHFARPAGDV